MTMNIPFVLILCVSLIIVIAAVIGVLMVLMRSAKRKKRGVAGDGADTGWITCKYCGTTRMSSEIRCGNCGASR